MATKKGKLSKGEKSYDHDHDDLLSKTENKLDEQELEDLYAWVDTIPLSRPKRNITRDFSDGVLCAELVKHSFPNEGIVQLHNYTPSHATNKKKENWFYLNRKVFSQMNFELAEDVIDDLVCCKGGMIEKVLFMLKTKIQRANYAKQRQSDKPEADQHHHHHHHSPGRKGGRAPTEESKAGRSQRTRHQHDPKSAGNLKPLNKRRTGPVVESDAVPRYLLEEKEQDVLARDETIQILNNKILKLEYLLQLKDRRLEDLGKQLQQQEQHQLYHYQFYQQPPQPLQANSTQRNPPRDHRQHPNTKNKN